MIDGMQLHVRMAPRDPDEAHRASTPLELFFDLTFVVAVAQAAAGLHHGLVGGHPGDALVAFPLVFFGIWWAWMNFTWFASAYDTDDAAYRLAVLVLMAGVLIMAAGIPRVFDGRHFGVIVAGYVVMRMAMVGLWLRAAASHPEGRPCARRYAGGHRRPPGLLGRPAGAARERGRPLVPRAGGGGAGRTAVGRGPGPHVVAPPPHRRALRPVHDHRAGRGHPRRQHRRAGSPRRPRPLRRHRHRRRRRAADRVLHVVDLLRHAGRAAGGTGPPGLRRAPVRAVRVGLRALRRVRQRGGGGGGPGRGRRPGHPPLRAHRRSRPGSPSPSRWRCTC